MLFYRGDGTRKNILDESIKRAMSRSWKEDAWAIIEKCSFEEYKEVLYLENEKMYFSTSHKFRDGKEDECIMLKPC
ncbi:hypothetical protein [Coxiella endosymbiont of Ornithodoros amblus]|uniref:hypothetical protein n=1 Tax=Coxiella endosymbiont of Ornithodoros amblus TaxID=1656166 RepID=UPI00244DE7BD|nr:hypothetical protein [Coxiella endosymbiont of Ornithodoros amblus]